MGVFYLLFYIFGAALVTLGGARLIDAIWEGEGWASALQILGVGAGLVVGAAILQGLVQRRRGHAGVLDQLPALSGRGILLALAIYLGSILAAWVQFELFMEPVHMFPFVTVLSAMAMVFGLVQRVVPAGNFRWALLTAAVALFGLPVGLLGLGLPIAHFNHHLTSVRFSLTNPSTYETQEFNFPADAPEPPVDEVSPLGEGTLGILEALGSAEEIDVTEEIAAGRMRRLEDGTLVTIHEDGRETTLVTGEAALGELSAAFDRAWAEDEERAARERAERRAAWEREMLLRKRGGRLFSRPDELLTRP